MSDKDLEKLRKEHPRLYNDVVSGRLPEASGEFVQAAKEYPIEAQV